MHEWSEWEPYTAELQRRSVAAGSNNLEFPVVQHDEQIYVSMVAVQLSAGGAKPLRVGHVHGDHFHRFDGDAAPSGDIPSRFDLSLTMVFGNKFRVQCTAMVGTETVDVWLHGYRRYKIRHNGLKEE